VLDLIEETLEQTPNWSSRTKNLSDCKNAGQISIKWFQLIPFLGMLIGTSPIPTHKFANETARVMMVLCEASATDMLATQRPTINRAVSEQRAPIRSKIRNHTDGNLIFLEKSGR